MASITVATSSGGLLKTLISAMSFLSSASRACVQESKAQHYNAFSIAQFTSYLFVVCIQ